MPWHVTKLVAKHNAIDVSSVHWPALSLKGPPSRKPFTGVNQDIFLFNENGSENGIPVMRYSSKRAIETWPREVIPVKGWYSPTDVIFGGYNVKIPSKKYLDWYLEYAYGENWKTHDEFGNEISKVPCALHSSIMSTNINK
mgnify:CR=1 FL=1